MPKRALISVSDKAGVAAFAKRLSDAGWEIISTGGTQKALEEAGVTTVSVEDITGFPECFSGRVKTMHPKIMGGVLMRRNNENDLREASENGIEPIDLIVVNLYPFEDGVANQKSDADLIELIDIGGPTLLRSAAKNHMYVTVITDPADYDTAAEQIERDGDTTPEFRRELANTVFARTTQYDAAIAAALSEGETTGVQLRNKQTLRYGENPHQWGAYYDIVQCPRAWSVVQEEKPMSYLNILDADGAWNLVQEFTEPAAACIKHANPSGVACDSDITEAFQKSYDADKLSAFGVIIALNRPCTEAIVQKIIDQKIFVEVVIAPEYDDAAVELLKKKPKIRALSMRDRGEVLRGKGGEHPVIRNALGGVLVQEEDTKVLSESDLECVTETKPTDAQVADLLFAWKVVKHAKSNAIVFAKGCTTVGIGCGQTSRVDSTIIAARRAGERSQGAVMASDAFFPFPDSVEEAAKNGIAAIIQPGGSIRDDEVIAKANELGIPMVVTDVRAFRH